MGLKCEASWDTAAEIEVRHMYITALQDELLPDRLFFLHGCT